MRELSDADLMDLIDRTRAGDRDAEDRLLRAVREYVKWLTVAHTGPVEPSDLAQDTVTRVWRKLPTFEGKTAAQFRAWVATIARHRAYDITAPDTVPLPENSAGGINLAGPDPTASEAVRRTEQVNRDKKTIAALSAAEQEVIRLRHEDDLGWEEIAGVLGVTPAAAQKRYWRARAKLEAADKQRGES